MKPVRKPEKNNTLGIRNAEAEKRPFRKLLVLFFAAILLMLVLVAGSIAYVDPFFVYHAPLAGFPYAVDNQLAQNPGMARHMEYDSIVTGSSMTFNFDMNDFRSELGLNTLKLSYAGAYPHNNAIIMDVVFEKEGIRAVFLPVDIPTMTGGMDETKYPVPWYLYDSDPLNDAPYLLNRDVLLQYVLKPLIRPEPTDLAHVYEDTWRTDEWYGTERVLADYIPAPRADQETLSEALIGPAARNLEVNLLPYIEAHPDTTFYLFYPPYSILYWYNLIREKRFEATLAEIAYINERLLQYENVRLFFFQDDAAYVTDLDHYADYTHYHPDMNRMMVTRGADGTGEIGDVADSEAALERVRHMTEAFDFGALFEAYGIETD